MTPFVSVVIPAYNEEKFIAKTLDSLVAQKIKSTFEVIVVDNNSTDDTSKIVKKYSKKLNLHLVHEPKKGRGTARSKGASLAKGEVILCADADTIYPKNWIETALKYFENPKVVAITGPWKAQGVSKKMDVFLDVGQEITSVVPSQFFLGHPWLTGFNMAVRSDAYHKCGGFNSKINSQEDLDLTFRIRKLGKIVYARDMVVTTSNRRFKDGLVKGFWGYEKSAIDYFVLGKDNPHLDDKR
jgi:glycosyltransferase involved in cell wall biosynthesis